MHEWPPSGPFLGKARKRARARRSGGGSIPFEAARIGCDVYASDLNPIACMLTWGAFNIIGAPEEKRAEIEAAQKAVAEAVDAEITQLGIEHDRRGNRAKAFLYCLETRCPKTGWMVPMAPLGHLEDPQRRREACPGPREQALHYRSTHGSSRKRRWRRRRLAPYAMAALCIR